MEESRKYVVDGFELIVPVYRDDFSGRYLEDYSEWYNFDKFTSNGHLILVSAERACEFAESCGSSPCVECAVCRFYSRAAPKTLIGVCMNPKKSNNKKEGKENETI
ncbi:MAG: hypothetical protein LUD77_04395 [Clostridiales bacterium]|nr:hypothetical protein [Clostridiales bacterium]